MSLDGKTAVVTGAAMGIGKAITETLMKNGAKVVLLDTNESAAASLMKSLKNQGGDGRTLFLKCDVESEEQLKGAFQKAKETFGGIDIVCNNAGIMNEDAWEKTISINLTSVLRGSYIALEHMSKLNGGQGGVIVNTASMAGIGSFPSCPAYTASKFGVVGFTRAIAASSQLLGYGVRFNAICPGFVETDLLRSIPKRLGRFEPLTGLVDNLMETMGILTVDDVADGVLELVTDESKNGEALVLLTKGKKTYFTFPTLQSQE